MGGWAYEYAEYLASQLAIRFEGKPVISVRDGICPTNCWEAIVLEDLTVLNTEAGQGVPHPEQFPCGLTEEKMADLSMIAENISHIVLGDLDMYEADAVVTLAPLVHSHMGWCARSESGPCCQVSHFKGATLEGRVLFGIRGTKKGI